MQLWRSGRIAQKLRFGGVTVDRQKLGDWRHGRWQFREGKRFGISRCALLTSRQRKVITFLIPAKSFLSRSFYFSPSFLPNWPSSSTVVIESHQDVSIAHWRSHRYGVMTGQPSHSHSHAHHYGGIGIGNGIVYDGYGFDSRTNSFTCWYRCCHPLLGMGACHGLSTQLFKWPHEACPYRMVRALCDRLRTGVD